MAAFNLTAELNLRGPSNLNQVVSNIRRQLSTVSLNLNINPNTSRGIQTVTNNVRTLNTVLRDAQTNATALSNTLANLAASINNVGNATNNINNGLNNLRNQTRNTANGTREAASEMEEFGRQSALAVRRFAAFSVATGAIYGLVRALSSAYSEFVNFNREFVRLQQVTNSTAAGLSGLSQEITRLSTGLGVSSSELLTVSTTLAQAGLSANQTKTALEALAKSALAPSFDNLNDTVEGSIALMRQFGLSAGDLEGALGSINAVAAKFAVEAGDIITAIQRTGGVFAAASKGVSQGKDALNEFIAVFTSVRATTRESAETIATGLRTIFTRIQRGGTIQALKEFGIVLTDLQGKFVGPYEAVRRLSQGLQSLDPRDLRFSQIVEELGGFRQIGKVIPLIQQFATAQQALSVAQRGAGSLAADQAKAQEALAVRITKVREEFIALIRDIGQTQSFQKFVDISLKLASALISVASSAKEVLPALTAIAAIRAIPAIGQYARGVTGGIGGRRRGFATGGMVPGSGSGDTVPAMLTPGEFVIRKKAVEAIGVDKLAALNRNGGGPIRSQYFNKGGLVQRFAGGGGVQKLVDGEYVEGSALAALKELTRDFLMPRSRKGGRRKISFTTQKAVAISKQIPPELLEQIEKEGRLVSGTGLREDLPKGSLGLVVDKVVNVALAKAKRRKAGQLKKTQGALTFSAAELQRGPRPPEELRGKRGPDGQFSMRTPAYLAADPEFNRIMGVDTGIKGGFLKQFEAQAKKEGIFTSPKSLLDRFPQAKSQLENFRGSLEKQLIEQQSKTKKDPKIIKSLQDQITKTSTALQDIDKYIKGGVPANAGRASHFAWSMRQAIPESKEFADGGEVQKFMAGEFVQKSKKPKIPSYANPKAVQKALNSGADIRTFGLVGIKGGAGQGSYFNQRLVAKPKGMNPVPVKIQVGTLEQQEAKDKAGFAQSIDNDIKKLFNLSIRKTARKLGSLLKSDVKSEPSASIDKIVDNSGFQQVVGSVFEGALNMIGAPYFEKNQSTKSMDFPFGLAGVSSLFNIQGNIPTDATRTVGSGGKGPGRMIGQIERFLAAEAKGLYQLPTQALTSSQIQNLASRARNRQTAEEINNILFSKGRQSGKKAIPLFLSVGKKAGQVPKGLEEHIQQNDEVMKALMEKGYFDPLVEAANGGIIKRFALGGPSGSDTVPAMLTPGEFVINKQAAQRIGSNNLHKLNNADKVKGFNKGGSVGHVQSFAEGGSVLNGQNIAIAGVIAGLAFLTRSITGLDQIISRSSVSLTRFNRTVDMGLPRTGQGTARGTGTRDFTNQGQAVRARGISGFGQTADAAGIIFGGTALATSIGEGVGGTSGKVISEVGTAVSSVVGVAASIGALSNPVGQFTTLLVAGVSIVGAWNKALKDAAIEREQKNIESRGSILDKTFERMANATNSTQKTQNTEIFLSTLAKNLKSSEIIRQNQISAATPAFNIGMTKETLVDAFDYTKLGQEFAQSSKENSDRILSFINQGLQENLNLDQIFKQLEGAGISSQSYRTAIGLAGVTGTDIAETQARLAVRESKLGADSPQAKTLRNSLNNLLELAFRDFKTQATALQTSQKAVVQLTESLRPFTEVMQQVSAASNRAAAEFQEAQRTIDIGVGSAFGGETSIAPVSRLNENVLSNLRGYSNEEIASTIDKFGASARLDRDFTNKVKSAALSQKVLQTELPKILSGLSASELQGEFGQDREKTIENQLREALKVAEVDPDFINTILNEIIKNLRDSTSKNKTLDDVLRSSEVLNKIMQNNESLAESMVSIMKNMNDGFDAVRNRLNQYVGALEQAINAQSQATQIRLQAENQLADALGQNLSIGERNQPFNREILDLTRNIDRSGNPVAGTGTLSPAEIAKRLDAANERRQQLENTKGGQSAEQFAGELTQVTLQARQLENALKKLSTDGSRAANALSQLQKLRQERFSKQNAFFDFASNANDPEFLTNFINDFASLTRITSGGGGLQDVQGAIRAFQTRASTLPSEQAEAERNQFGTMLAQRFGLPKQLIDAMFKQTQAETDAIADFRAATEAQAQATELAANRTRDAAQGFYDKVLEAAQAFLNKVSGASNDAAAQKPAKPVNPARKASGGLIYANKGQYINFEPKGTDTVPAMLTPGEFVVNAKATKQNLGLLKQINNGGKASGFSRGGVVYLVEGGSVPGQRKLSEEEIAGIAAMIQDITNTIDRYEQEAFDIGRMSDNTPEQINRLNELSTLIDGLGNRRNKLLNKINLPNIVTEKNFNKTIREQKITDPQPLREELINKPKEQVNSIVRKYLDKRSDERDAAMQKLEAANWDYSALSPEDRETISRAEKTPIGGDASNTDRAMAIELAQKNLKYEQKQTERQSNPTPATTNTPKSKFEAEKERRQQAFLSEKERRKQAAMAANPGYAKKVAREEAKKREELTKAQEETGLADPVEALKVYQQRKRERIQQRNSQMARADRERASAKASEQPIAETPIDPIKNSPSMILLRQAQEQDAAAEANKIALEEKYAEEQRLRDKKFQTEIDNIPSRLQAEKDKKIAEDKTRMDARVAALNARDIAEDNKARSMGYNDRFAMDKANRVQRRQNKLKAEAETNETIATGIAGSVLIDPISRQILNIDDPANIQAEIDRLNEIKSKRLKEIGSEELLERSDPQLLSKLRKLQIIKRAAEIAITRDELKRSEEIQATDKEYQQLAKAEKSGQLRPQDAQRYARLSLIRGLKPADISGGRTLEAERELRDEGIGEDNRKKLEKKELKKFKEDLRREKQTSFYDKITGELAARAGVGAEKLTGSKAVGVAAQLGVGLLGGVADPTNFASPAGFGPTGGFLVDVAAGVGGIGVGLATKDEDLVNQAFIQAATIVGLGATTRSLGVAATSGKKFASTLREGASTLVPDLRSGIREGSSQITGSFSRRIRETVDQAQQKFTNFKEARRVRKEARRVRQAQREASNQAIENSKTSLRESQIRKEMIDREVSVNQAVKSGQRTEANLRRMGLEPPNFANESSSVAAITKEALEERQAVRNFRSGGTQRGSSRARSSAADASTLTQNKASGSRNIDRLSGPKPTLDRSQFQPENIGLESIRGQYRNKNKPLLQGPTKITGFKGAIQALGDTPEEFLINNKKIEAWLAANVPQFKIHGDKSGEFWRFYTQTGSRDEFNTISARIQKELSGVYDPKFTYANDIDPTELFNINNTPGISGRFDLNPGDLPSEQQRVSELIKKSGLMPQGNDWITAGVRNSTDPYVITENITRDIITLSKRLESTTDPSEIKILQENIRLAKEKTKEILSKNIPEYRNSGGLIYASKGSLIPYQPRGTDTVPAMLTPGEFVVNKRAAQQNRGLLHAINNNKVQKFSKGGSVQYFDQGSNNGPVQAIASSGAGSSSLSLDSSEFSTAVNNFNGAVGSLSSSLGSFNGVANTLAASIGGIGTAAGALSTAASVLSSSAQDLNTPIQEFKKSLDSIGSVLSKIPSEINFKVSGSIPVVVSVDVNGGEGLADQLQPFANQIFSKVSEGIRRATNGNLNIEISSELA